MCRKRDKYQCVEQEDVCSGCGSRDVFTKGFKAVFLVHNTVWRINRSEECKTGGKAAREYREGKNAG